MENLNELFWNSRYANGETGWDLEAVSPPLKEYIDGLQNKNLSIIIPGCGNAHEATYFLEKGFKNITLVDIASEAVKRLREKFAMLPINVVHSDFFEHEGSYDLMLEQTFFCAIHPELRGRYVKHAHKILKPNGVLAGLLFNCKFEKADPPFGGEQKEYEKLFAPFFETKKIETAKNSVKPRSGNEIFIELIKKI